VVGHVAAGQPILAEENIEEYMQVPAAAGGDDGGYILRVRGESMKDIGMMEGDYVVVRPQETARDGEIVVALVGEEATVKRYFPRRDKVLLIPENEEYEPIEVRPSDPEFRAAFVAYIEWGSRIAVENSGGSAEPPPNMPVPRWWWVCNATPGSRPSATAGDEVAEVEAGLTLPGADEAVRFDDHIRPLFRPMDRNSMLFAFDLWKEADVALHRQQILLRLRAGTMPCDGAWPNEKVTLFERWAADQA